MLFTETVQLGTAALVRMISSQASAPIYMRRLAGVYHHPELRTVRELLATHFVLLVVTQARKV